MKKIFYSSALLFSLALMVQSCTTDSIIDSSSSNSKENTIYSKTIPTDSNEAGTVIQRDTLKTRIQTTNANQLENGDLHTPLPDRRK